jgi:hypothetical protein
MGAVVQAHPSPLPAVQAWLRDRQWWEQRVRMIGEAAELHGGPIGMEDETPPRVNTGELVEPR